MRFLLGVIFALNLACSPTQEFSDFIKTAKANSESSSSEPVDDDLVASEPIQVGGSFLVCAQDLSSPVNEGRGYLGCRMEDVNGQKLKDFSPKPGDLEMKMGTETMTTVVAGPDSFWHWLLEFELNRLQDYSIRFVGTEVRPHNDGNAMILEVHPAQGGTPPVMPETPKYHTVFLSSKLYGIGSEGDNFDSLSSADAKCMELSSTEFPDQKFKALLSDSATAAIKRIVFEGPIILPDTTVISNPNLFWVGSHNANIDMDEKGKTYADPESLQTWTATKVNGNSSEFHCNNWTSSLATDSAIYGLANSKAGGRWINNGVDSCDKRFRLYCISQ